MYFQYGFIHQQNSIKQGTNKVHKPISMMDQLEEKVTSKDSNFIRKPFATKSNIILI
jgi:hypothetical protein